ncbi:MAG TPA: LacI family DNA-binding transcriptional regulator [Intrasporangium sp.]|uniref:LacI family DNA-binding transcriptional regulator n=1 Tax=Intrasporangium sp. TaxID=1925024 RepID=UPI002D79D2F8|nr:LacI family DNA-binding transcriptional regulator [Intrasporangium sp.]HET7397339.1 LacI family DNA-binding transcriptional regulator [Intrasporangium sp.]
MQDQRRRAYRVTDIAAQSGLSRATVDRVLHGRPGVRPETAAQVERAIDELQRQRTQIHLSSKAILLDLVMQTPERFAAACRSALEAELQALRPAVVRARFDLGEHSDPARAAAALERIARRGSHGVILKAPDHPEVSEAVRRLRAAGIPTVTFVTDIPASGRAAYVGMDNVAAGATAAYVITNWAGSTGGVLLTLSHSSFRGEGERETGFRATLGQLAPDRDVTVVTDTDGLDETMARAVREALRDSPAIDAVYSIGGGNRAILTAFDEVGRRPGVFVAHDLDADNLELLRTRRVTVVLHHDLKADLRRACRLLLQAGRLLPGSPVSLPSQVQVVTPFNEPAALQLE